MLSAYSKTYGDKKIERKSEREIGKERKRE